MSRENAVRTLEGVEPDQLPRTNFLRLKSIVSNMHLKVAAEAAL